MPSLKSFVIGVAFMSLAISFKAPAQDNSFPFHFMGGALHTCSSWFPDQCKTLDAYLSSRKLALKDFSQKSVYQLRKDRLKQLVAHPRFLEALGSEAPQYVAKLKSLVNKSHETIFFRDEFIAFVSQAIPTTKAIVRRMITDFHEISPKAHYKFPEEKVFLHLNKDEMALTVLSDFIKSARIIANLKPEQKPKVFFSTASSANPFSAVGFYQQVFEQLGAEAIWLPTDAALSKAYEEKNCNRIITYREKIFGRFARELRYPDLHRRQLAFCKNPKSLLDKLDGSHAVFFNGGDQSLTRASFVLRSGDSPWLARIRTSVMNGSLVVGGTSAGAAIQSGGQLMSGSPIPMITSGTSLGSLQRGVIAAPPPIESCLNISCSDYNGAVTYDALGGFGLIPFGIFDTHFSERGRPIRLLQLMAKTKTQYGLGIDETTAIQLHRSKDQITFRVRGRSGVWIFSNDSFGKPSESDGSFLAHYLTFGDTGVVSLKTGRIEIDFSGHKQYIPQNMSFRPPNDSASLLEGKAFLELARQLSLTKKASWLGKIKLDQNAYQLGIYKTDEFKSVAGTVTIGGKTTSLQSMKALKIRLSPLPLPKSTH